MIIPKKPKTQSPALFDELISELQDHLETQLNWLSYIFGQAQILTRREDRGKEYKYPGVHIEAGEYANVLPDQNLNNFCFLLIKDPQKLDTAQTDLLQAYAEFSLIFWYDLRQVYPDTTDRNTEAVKKSILKVLTSDLALQTGRLTLNKIYEHSDNIFKEFSIRDVDAQHLMYPYAGIRIEGEMRLRDICFSS